MTEQARLAGVRVGQVWADRDSRSRGRQVQIVAVDSTHATVMSPTGLGRRTRIRLDRFRPTSTGFSLLIQADQ